MVVALWGSLPQVEKSRMRAGLFALCFVSLNRMVANFTTAFFSCQRWGIFFCISKNHSGSLSSLHKLRGIHLFQYHFLFVLPSSNFRHFTMRKSPQFYFHHSIWKKMSWQLSLFYALQGKWMQAKWKRECFWHTVPFTTLSGQLLHGNWTHSLENFIPDTSTSGF